RRTRRVLVNLILDPAYINDPRDASRLYITTANKERPLWLEQLAVPLGVATIAQRVSRRAVLGMGAGAVLTLAAGGAAATLLVRQQQAQALANQPLPVSRSSGQPNQMFTPSTASGDVTSIPHWLPTASTCMSWRALMCSASRSPMDPIHR
ncbi:MAG TPA: hypothetical protein VGN32_10960, partial [Ktedonobacterales bacterium]|nr:hypothetical protein [Ktedonobacterales bacterium]